MINQALALINNYICTQQDEKTASTLKMVKELQPEHEAYQFFDKNQPCEIFGKNWDHEDLDGKSLEIFCDHGMGDTIMMFRYMKKLKEKYDVKIILNSLQYDSLKRLMDTLDFVDVFTKNHEGCDYHTNIMQLPQKYHGRFLWKWLEFDIPIPDQPLLVSQARPCKLGNFGLKYNSNRDSNLFSKKSIDPALFDEDWITLEPDENIKTDILDLMVTMATLGLIVSVDTLTLHLAGSMGLKTFGLLHRGADPRWGQDDVFERSEETKTPWYPSVTLLRQEEEGNWGNVLDSLRSSLT